MTIINLENINEEEGLTLLHHLVTKFGWAGTMFTRGDAEQEYIDQMEVLDSTPLPVPDSMPDEVWDAVCSTWEWRRGMEDTLCERGWGLVTDAVSNVIDSLSEDVEDQS